MSMKHMFAIRKNSTRDPFLKFLQTNRTFTQCWWRFIIFLVIILCWWFCQFLHSHLSLTILLLRIHHCRCCCCRRRRFSIPTTTLLAFWEPLVVTLETDVEAQAEERDEYKNCQEKAKDDDYGHEIWSEKVQVELLIEWSINQSLVLFGC